MINLYVFVDCVLIGFDGEQFCVLLVRQVGKQFEDGYNNMKLLGSFIYDDEDLDEVVKWVLNELMGLKNVKFIQFKVYGLKDCICNFKDVLWLECFYCLDEKKIDCIVIIVYLILVKIDRWFEQLFDKYDVCWIFVMEVKSLVFDYFQILQDVLVYICYYVEYVFFVMFDLFFWKFMVVQLWIVYQLIYDKVFDVRNFYKKIVLMLYVVFLEEKQVGVCYRVVCFYKFDCLIYNKLGMK